MDEEDEVAIACGTTWTSVEGCLERSVRIARETDQVETPGPTGRLVLVPPSEESGPCELTVTFRRRLCHIHQVYVLSTARTVEIYSQLEQDSEAEYVATVRGELVSLLEDEGLQKNREDDQGIFSDSSQKTRGENGASPSAALAFEEIKSELTQEDAVHRVPPKEDTGAFVGEWKEQLFTSNESSWGRSGDSEEESFQSLSDGVSGKMVEGSIIFDEPMDQTDWVECPHSPMKNSALSSDDEVDINKCGYFIVDSDGEAQYTEHPRIILFPERFNISLDHALRSPLEAGMKQAGQHGGIQLSVWKEEAAVEKGDAPSECRGGSNNDQGAAQEQSAEERSQPSTASLTQVVNESVVQSDQSSEPRDVPDVQSTENHGGFYYDFEASTKACFTGIEDIPEEIPVYRAEMNLDSTDAWRSVKIRLLSLKDKSKLSLHKVIITLVPGPTISPMSKSAGSFGSFQQSAGSSSLLAMLGPGIFQMARGLANSRKVNSVGLMSGERKLVESKISPTLDSTNASLSVLGSGLSSPTPGTISSSFAGSSTTSSSLEETVDQKKYDFPLGKEKAACSLETERFPSSSQPLQEEPCRSGMGVVGDSCFPVAQKLESQVEFARSEVVGIKVKNNLQGEKSEEGEDRDFSDQVVKRLDRLEAICLRMESTLNFALENMDRRLKLLEGGAVGRMPGWGASYESGPFVSASSVNLPPVQAGMETGSVVGEQTHICTSASVDAPAGQLPEKGVGSRTRPFYPGLMSSTSLLSSVSPALPLWPLSSPKHVSHEPKFLASSTTTYTTHSKNGHVDQLNSSSHGQAGPVRGGDSYWESQTSDDSGSDMSSDSEHISYANSEDPDPFSCPESVSSSPAKPHQQVENALASALSAFSVSFDAAVVNSPKQKVSFQKEDEETEEKDSFTSEEQAPLVDIECFSLGVEDERRQTGTEVLMEGYEAIPIAVDKDSTDVKVGELSQEDVFWHSEVEKPDKGSTIDWQDDMLRSQDEKLYSPHADSGKKVGKNPTVFGPIPHPLLDISDVLCMDDLTTYDLFPTDFERILRDEQRTEAEGGQSPEALELDRLPNPFVQELSFIDDGDILAREDSWCEEWTEKQLERGDTVTVTYMTVRGFSKPLDPHKEMQLQEEMFQEDWNWFTSDLPPASNEDGLPESLLGNGCLKPGANVAVLVDLSEVENDESGVIVGNDEPLSLLDADAAVVGGNNQFRVDAFSGQKTHWSLLDEDPPIASSVDFRPEERCPDEWLRHIDQRSLLDEDMYIPPGNVTSAESGASLSPPYVSPEEQYDLSGVIRPQPKFPDAVRFADTARSPSSHTPRSNPFEEDCNERQDLTEENRNRNFPLHDDFCEEVHEFEAPGSERTQSLLFHLSL